MKVHINQLPLKNNYVILREQYGEALFSKFLQFSGSIAEACRLSGISKSMLGQFIRLKTIRVRLDFLFKIIGLLNIPVKEAEKKIAWVGNKNSLGITNPRLPFDFNSRAGARFLAAICNEGWISNGAYYSNSSYDLRNSVRKDALSVFGGNQDAIKDWVKEKDQYLSFPSIIRDVLILMTEYKGVKSVNNPPVPSFILESTELICGWLEQTIADEGHIKYYPDKHRREIIWRRSFNRDLNEHKLNRDEREMLDKLGIKYDLKKIGVYKTNKGIEKVRLQLRLSKRENLLKLRELVKIPDTRKDQAFSDMMSFERYKEPLRIKEAIIKICKEKGFVTSTLLKQEMNYKQSNAALKWLKYYQIQGLIIRLERSFYKKGFRGGFPAKYGLSISKSFLN